MKKIELIVTEGNKKNPRYLDEKAFMEYTMRDSIYSLTKQCVTVANHYEKHLDERFKLFLELINDLKKKNICRINYLNAAYMEKRGIQTMKEFLENKKIEVTRLVGSTKEDYYLGIAFLYFEFGGE